MTDTVMSDYKKLIWPNNKAALGECYQLLCTNLGDGILHVIYYQTIISMEKMVFISDEQ